MISKQFFPKKVGFSRAAFCHIWNNLSQDILDHNITNISVRIQAVLIKTYSKNDGKIIKLMT